MAKVLLLLVAGTLALITPITAQDPVAPGRTVRVSTDSGRVQGTISEQTDRELTLATEAGSRAIPLASISRLEARNGKNRGKGALIGAGVGILVGGILAPLTTRSESCDCVTVAGSSLAEASITGEAVLLGALVGGSMGGLLGAFVLAPNRWTAHPLPTGSAFRPVTSAAGWRVGLKFSF